MIRTDSQLLSVCQGFLHQLGARGTELVVEPMNVDRVGLTVFRKYERPLIIINSVLCAESDTVIKTIVAHEYGHVIAGQTAQHSSKWSAIANKFSQKLGGLEVTQDPLQVVHFSAHYWLNNFRYVYCCESCGKFIGFNEEQFANLGSSVTHNNCGGSWKKIK